MLLSFRVANHKSFRDEQELLLLPAYDRSRQATSIAAIYGANASGKSNLLDALNFMRGAVLDSFIGWRPRGGVPRSPFKLDPDARTDDSTFGVDIRLGGQKYVYGFSANDQRITEEWLYHYPRNRRRVLFERAGDEFRFGDSLRGPRAIVEEVTRENSLFLSAAAQHDLRQLIPVYQWFERCLRPVDPASRFDDRSRAIDYVADRRQARRILQLMLAADLGIGDIRLVEAGEERSRVDDQPTRAVEHRVRPGTGSENTPALVVDYISLGPASPRVLFRHKTPGGTADLELSEESQGTQAWFDSLGVALDVLDHGRVLVVDELDTSLHPLLVRQFVRMFKEPETNPNGAQLVFTTHDTSLLARYQGEDVLGRDEIWFTEKDEDGASHLYPLTDFKPRTGLNWERRYLGGAIGAIPFLDQDDFAGAVGRRDEGD